MNAPLLKIYTKRSTGEQMDAANLALSAEEQMNLMQNTEENTTRTPRSRSTSQIITYSLEDLFNLNQYELDDTTYQVIENVESQNQQAFKYVQVRKEFIETSFSKYEVLQLIDISQKILYDQAVGEKRLFSLINATVSHDMRNPTNSIQVQVQEQQTLNQKVSEVTNNLSSLTVKKSKKKLEGILARL